MSLAVGLSRYSLSGTLNTKTPLKSCKLFLSLCKENTHKIISGAIKRRSIQVSVWSGRQRMVWEKKVEKAYSVKEANGKFVIGPVDDLSLKWLGDTADGNVEVTFILLVILPQPQPQPQPQGIVLFIRIRTRKSAWVCDVVHASGANNTNRSASSGEHFGRSIDQVNHILFAWLFFLINLTNI